MKNLFTKIKNWLFRPVSAKLKSRAIIGSLVSLFILSIFFAICIHWILIIIPILHVVILLYAAKLPIKAESPKPTIKKGGFYGKKKK